MVVGRRNVDNRLGLMDIPIKNDYRNPGVIDSLYVTLPTL
jgi:hypothetical protein